jgi:hypothetical protein
MCKTLFEREYKVIIYYGYEDASTCTGYSLHGIVLNCLMPSVLHELRTADSVIAD